MSNDTTEQPKTHHLQFWVREQGLMLTVSFTTQQTLDETLENIRRQMETRDSLVMFGCIIPTANILFIKSIHGRLV